MSESNEIDGLTTTPPLDKNNQQTDPKDLKEGIKTKEEELTKKSKKQIDSKNCKEIGETIEIELTEESNEQTDPKNLKHIEETPEEQTENSKVPAIPKDFKAFEATKEELTEKINEQADLHDTKDLKEFEETEEKKLTEDRKKKANFQLQATPQDLKEFDANKEELTEVYKAQAIPIPEKLSTITEELTEESIEQADPKNLKHIEETPEEQTENSKVPAIPKDLKAFEATKEELTEKINEQADLHDTKDLKEFEETEEKKLTEDRKKKANFQLQATPQDLKEFDANKEELTEVYKAQAIPIPEKLSTIKEELTEESNEDSDEEELKPMKLPGICSRFLQSHIEKAKNSLFRLSI
ncbi:uncharacterized protein Dwil_GK15684 [Drosophila willistoni]|uniref:Uncharacterized protein n=1 Tax=Drosophila willistoni TaxID=7260 RepID=B4MRW0_DROWI|nr:myosin-J heavy chain [Drosophila willistoni]EDW74849.1 uncharacterized protein Dwil_GK15684 [Drosophila willistoni]